MRTTRKQLEHLVFRINRELGRPVDPYTNGKANIGNVHLDVMNPGDGTTYALEVMGNENGGVSRPFFEGRLKAGEMYALLTGILAGIEAARK